MLHSKMITIHTSVIEVISVFRKRLYVYLNTNKSLDFI